MFIPPIDFHLLADFNMKREKCGYGKNNASEQRFAKGKITKRKEETGKLTGSEPILRLTLSLSSIFGTDISIISPV